MFLMKKGLVGVGGGVLRPATPYFRFLNSIVPSISVMYSKPFSISCVASFMFVAVLQ